jgi:hypothetical protein
LFFLPGEEKDWRSVKALTEGCPTEVMNHTGAISVLLPGFGQPVNAFFLPGMNSGREIELKKNRVAAATFIVVPRPLWFREERRVFDITPFLSRAVAYRLAYHSDSAVVLQAHPKPLNALLPTSTFCSVERTYVSAVPTR